MGEAGVEGDAGHHDSQAVGPDDAEQMRPGRGQHGPGQFPAMGRVAFRKAGGDDHHRLGAPPAQLVDEPGHRIRRCRDHRQIGRLGEAVNGRIGGKTGDGLVFGVDRKDLPGEAGAEEIAGQHAAHRPRFLTGADQGHRGRGEDMVEVSHRHGCLS